MWMTSEVATVLVPLFLTTLFGGLVAYLWNVRQKQRELGLSTQHDFYRLFGEFISNWRLWNALIEDDAYKGLDRGVEAWHLLQRVAAAEAGLDAVLVKVATSRPLTDDEIAVLGSFRQAFQSLRDSMRLGEPLPWRHDGAVGYAAFKYLAVQVAALLARPETLRRPSSETAAGNFRAVMSNYWEDEQLGDWRKYCNGARTISQEDLLTVVAKLRLADSNSYDIDQRPWL